MGLNELQATVSMDHEDWQFDFKSHPALATLPVVTDSWVIGLVLQILVRGYIEFIHAQREVHRDLMSRNGNSSGSRVLMKLSFHATVIVGRLLISGSSLMGAG